MNPKTALLLFFIAIVLLVFSISLQSLYNKTHVIEQAPFPKSGTYIESKKVIEPRMNINGKDTTYIYIGWY